MNSLYNHQQDSESESDDDDDVAPELKPAPEAVQKTRAQQIINVLEVE